MDFGIWCSVYKCEIHVGQLVLNWSLLITVILDDSPRTGQCSSEYSASPLVLLSLKTWRKLRFIPYLMQVKSVTFLKENILLFVFLLNNRDSEFKEYIKQLRYFCFLCGTMNNTLYFICLFMEHLRLIKVSSSSS